SQSQSGCVQEMTVLLLGHGNALQHQDNRTPRGADIDRLVGGIQHQDRRVQRMHITFLMNAHANAEYGSGDTMPSVVRARIVPVRHTHDALAIFAPPECPDVPAGNFLALSNPAPLSFNVRATVATHTFSAP